MHLSVEAEEFSFGTRHWLRVRRSVKPDLDIFFDFLGEHDIDLPHFMDGHVQAIIHRAMRSGESVFVHGAMSRAAVHNLGEYQDAMHAYHPLHYRRVEIRPDAVVDPASSGAPPRAITLFSGGVDGSFGLIRHRRVIQDESALPIEAALIIHHLQLDDVESFERLVKRVRPFCDGVGVALHVARTNLRKVVKEDYLHTYGAQLSSALQNFANRYNYGVIGSSEPYIALILPFGSSPVTDHLMSGGAMRIIHDGAGFTRTEKVAVLAQYPEAMKGLHVCLKHAYENCGECMKCVRTRMNFLAVGVSEVEFLPGPFDLNLIDELKLTPDHVASELRTLLDYARRNGVRGEWTDRLQQRLDRGGSQRGTSQSPRRKLKGLLRRLRLLGPRGNIGTANPTPPDGATASYKPEET